MNNEDFITIRKINRHLNVQSDKVIVPIVDWVNSIDSLPCQPFIQTKLTNHTVSISKDYNKRDIFKEFINKVIEICEPDSYNERVREHKTVKEISTELDIRQLVSRIISCGSYIATNGRIGPAHFVLLPNKYYNKLLPYITDFKLASMYVISTDLLIDKIILGRKNDDNQPGIFLFLDEIRNKYSLTKIGTAKNQYHILKMTCLKTERRKKLQQIKKKNNIKNAYKNIK